PFKLDDSHGAVEIQFGRAGSQTAIMIRHAPKVAEPPPEPEPEPVVEEALEAPPELQSPPPEPEPVEPPPPVVRPSAVHRGEPRDQPANEIDTLLLRMLEAGASDLHLSTGSAPVFRVDGDLSPQGSTSLTSSDVERLIQQILPDRGKRELAERNDADFAY